MKTFFALLIVALSVCGVFAQDPKQKIYETEKAFEKAVAEKGINQGFIEFLAPEGIIFSPKAVNGRERWRSRPPSPAALTWNPIWIDVSSNGALAYSIGNSMYRAKGKDDTNIFYGHYLSIWSRQGNREYRAALDTGINHEKPSVIPIDWKSPADSGKEKIDAEPSAADHSTGFFLSVEKQGTAAAYSSYLAEDAILMRDGIQPFFGKKAAIDYLKREKSKIVFAKRKSFVQASNLAYVNSTYKLIDTSGNETENGNFVQAWKLIGGKWKIVADVFVPLPKPTK